MKTYLIGYDLNRPRREEDYPELIDAIKKLGAWWHYLDSTWILKTDMTTVEIRDTLQPHIDSRDELLVGGLTGEGAWAGFEEKGSSWLKTNLPST